MVVVSEYRHLMLMRFLWNQAHLTDAHPVKPGPGCVQLNHDEARLVAFLLQELCRWRGYLPPLTELPALPLKDLPAAATPNLTE